MNAIKRTFLPCAATLVLGIAAAQFWNGAPVQAKSSNEVATVQRLTQLQAEVSELKSRLVRLEVRVEDQAKTRITPDPALTLIGLPGRRT